METGSIIRRIRKDKGLTLEQLALEVGADAANLSRFETGKQNASPAMLKKISVALDFPLSQMYLLLEQNIVNTKSHARHPRLNKSPNGSIFCLANLCNSMSTISNLH